MTEAVSVSTDPGRYTSTTHGTSVNTTKYEYACIAVLFLAYKGCAQLASSGFAAVRRPG